MKPPANKNTTKKQSFGKWAILHHYKQFHLGLVLTKWHMLIQIFYPKILMKTPQNAVFGVLANHQTCYSANISSTCCMSCFAFSRA